MKQQSELSFMFPHLMPIGSNTRKRAKARAVARDAVRPPFCAFVQPYTTNEELIRNSVNESFTKEIPESPEARANAFIISCLRPPNERQKHGLGIEPHGLNTSLLSIEDLGTTFVSKRAFPARITIWIPQQRTRCKKLETTCLSKPNISSNVPVSPESTAER